MSTDLAPRPQTGMQARPVDRLKAVLSAQSVQEQFRNALADAAPLFSASILDLVASSKELAECDPGDVVRECLKAAVLRLPIARGLGFAWVVPRRDHGRWAPQFQIGWKGLVQLAQRTGYYRSIHAGLLYEGQRVEEDSLTGEIKITGRKESDTVIGYVAHFRLLSGFEKAFFWSTERMAKHRERYVKGPGGAWVSHPHEMGTKTVLSHLLRKYGPMSVEMQQAIQSEPTEDAPVTSSEPLDILQRVTAEHAFPALEQGEVPPAETEPGY